MKLVAEYTPLLLLCVLVSTSAKSFPEECNKCCFAGFAFDVDFGCFGLQLQVQFFVTNTTRITLFSLEHLYFMKTRR